MSRTPGPPFYEAEPSEPKVLVVDSERVLAESLAVVLGVGEVTAPQAATGALEALRALDQQRVDVMLVGVEPGDGQEAFLTQVARRFPTVRIVAMSATDDVGALVTFVRLGVRGWVPKSAQVSDVARAIAGVARGEYWLPRSVLERAFRQLTVELGVDGTSRLSALTGRERQVLAALADGLPRAEIAVQLRMSLNTVRTHIQHVLVKLQVHTSLEAVTLALQEGLTPSPRSSPHLLLTSHGHRSS